MSKKKERKWKKRAALLFAVLPLGLAAPARAEFDCKNPRDAFERLMCGETIVTTQGYENGLIATEQKKIAALDDELDASYKESLAKHFDPDLLRLEQQAWFKARERCVLDSNCFLVSLYEDRIYHLRYNLKHPPQTEAERESARLLSMGSPAGDNFTFSADAWKKGYGCDFCEAMVRWLNHTTPKGDMPRYSFGKIVTSMPSLTYPAWKELDVQQYLHLFPELIKFINHGILCRPMSQYDQEQIEAAKNGKYRLWMIKENRVTSSGKQKTLVAISRRGDNDTTVNTEKNPTGLSSAIIVRDDFSEIDIPSTLEMGSGHGTLMYYKGEPYFVSGSGNSAYAKNPSVVCEIENFKHTRSPK